MQIAIKTVNGKEIAEVTSDMVIINTLEDGLDILANCAYQGAEKIIIHQHNLSPEFFDLKTRLAGDILQKFSTYRVQLAIVGDFSGYTSKSLRDFIFESNKGSLIKFVGSVEEATQ
ncbi:DUF4180 domain-containing protein [Spirosoma sp. BT702]|uniref:DUF4180 domain-containing protein n=1 Tax=Spirosoma profusum TaxID=2771354 RepID=A0A926XWW2_9BACT|nr:DUF4180 domain-containing protein [Spirosoma profusum]MBD2699332.1 DUF4180 domain-containing protein [Spirosoma profusum]